MSLNCSIREGHLCTNYTRTFEPAKAAFQEAKKLFTVDLIPDGSKPMVGKNVTSMDDILQTVDGARKDYEISRSNGKLKQKLTKFAGLLHHYGTIIEVFSQHHPEYVALAWGAMKFLLVVGSQTLTVQPT